MCDGNPSPFRGQPPNPHVLAMASGRDRPLCMASYCPGAQVSNEKVPGCLVYIGIIRPNYVGNTIKHYQDPYQTTSIMESKRVFFRGTGVSKIFWAVLSDEQMSSMDDHFPY